MSGLLKWIIIIAIIGFAYSSGFFDGIIKYFQNSYEYSQQEQVINEPDGSITTVRYKNIFDILTGK